MKSMTAFAHTEQQDAALQAAVDIKSYNNRYLDINVLLPGFLATLEPEVRSYVSRRVARGRVEVVLRLREVAQNLQIQIDPGTVAAYRDALVRLREVAGLSDPITMDHLLRFEEVLQVEKQREAGSYRPLVFALLERAFEAFESERLREGLATAQDITAQLQRIEDALAIVGAHAPQMEKGLQETVRSRFAQVLGDEIDLSRVYAETAMLLVKYSINEELSRMQAHLESFHEALQGGGAVGKRLDFLCQEINREVNTIGSKSFVLDISRQVVEMKDALENIREQLRNVE